MATIHSRPTHVEDEKTLMHFTLYLSPSLPASLCTVQFVINRTKCTELRLIPRILWSVL